MKPSVVALISAESAQAARINSSVQYDSSPNGYKSDAVIKKQPAADAAKVESLQIIQEPVSGAYPQAAVSPKQGLFSRFIKLLAVVRIPKQQFKNGLDSSRREDVVEGTEHLISEDASVLKAQKRKVELERIEGFKTGGM